MASNPSVTLHIKIGDALGSITYTYEEMAKTFTEQTNSTLKVESFRPYAVAMAGRMIGAPMQADQFFKDEELDKLYATYGTTERGDNTALVIRGGEITALTLEFKGENEGTILLA